MVYAYQFNKFSKSILVEVLREDGESILMKELFSKQAAMKYLEKVYPGEVEWIDGKLWEHPAIKNKKIIQQVLGFED